jgi:transcriptional regulator with XRE-family HTH domain
MKPRSHYEIFAESPEHRRMLSQSELLLDVTEQLLWAMEQEGVRKGELANRLGRSKAFVSQLFTNGRNLTLRTVADVADALGYKVRVTLHRRDVGMVTMFCITSDGERIGEWNTSGTALPGIVATGRAAIEGEMAA